MQLDLIAAPLSGKELADSFDDFIPQMEAELLAKVAAWDFPFEKGVKMTQPNSRYKLTSAMQKCIRRGMWEHAMYYAEAIYNSPNKDYLWQRLPLVMLEDVGLGNWEVCAYTMHFCRFAKFRNRAAGLKTLMYLIYHMTVSPKSRALSEAVCMGYFAEDLTHPQLVRVGDTMAALGWYPDIKERPNNPWLQRTVDATKFDVYQEVADLTNNPYIRYCFHAGNKRDVAYQNAAIPLILDLAASEEISVVETKFRPPRYIAKVPDWSFDKHTLQGKNAISAIRKCSHTLPPDVTQRQFGLALFQEESAPLDLEATNTQLSKMKHDSEMIELTTVGLGIERGMALREYLRSEVGYQELLKARMQTCSGA